MKLKGPDVKTQLQLLVWCYLVAAVLSAPQSEGPDSRFPLTVLSRISLINDLGGLLSFPSPAGPWTPIPMINNAYATGQSTDTSSPSSAAPGASDTSEHMTTQDHLHISSDFTTQAFKDVSSSDEPAGSSSSEASKPVTDYSSDNTADELSTTPSAPHSSHPCVRECLVGAAPMTCYYRFEVEGYLSMSKACYSCPTNATDCDRQDCVTADGAQRPLFVVNRQLPGPSIEVCEGDRIIVDVVNEHVEQSVTIHWHGIHQAGTPYMDGVPHVTQCPTEPGESFRYDFKASPAGTHFWHSHLGVQRANGIFGALIVRIPTAQDPNAHLFDYDLPAHTIQVLDWDHVTSTEKFMEHIHGSGDNKPPTLLVNGRGRNYEVQATDAGSNKNVYVPDVRFTVQKDGRYRFRLINAGFLNCPIQLSVDNHNITVIASDSSILQPIEVESLVSYAGERFDFVLTANQPIGNYWLRMRGLLDCDDRFKSAHQVAVLHYEGASDSDPLGVVSYAAARRDGQQLNSANVKLGTEGSVIITQLSSALDDDVRLKPEADLTFYISYDFYPVDNPLFHKQGLYGYNEVQSSQRRTTPQLNHISMTFPQVPLLSQGTNLDTSLFCNDSSVDPICRSQYCGCTHLLRVPLDKVVELVVIDEGSVPNASHPFHLHGADFRVIAMNLVGPNISKGTIQALDQSGQIKRKLQGAPIKDTVTIPNGGYTILRFQASNPGMWMFHCHLDFHSEIGMALVFQFGETTNFPPVPKDFPRCGGP